MDEAPYSPLRAVLVLGDEDTALVLGAKAVGEKALEAANRERRSKNFIAVRRGKERVSGRWGAGDLSAGKVGHRHLTRWFAPDRNPTG